MRVDGAEIDGENEPQRHAENMGADIHPRAAINRGVATQVTGNEPVEQREDHRCL